MRDYLTHSISSVNKNKINWLKADNGFKKYLTSLGYGENLSTRGWLFQSEIRGVGTDFLNK